ncbi:hypothetical protein [Streptomyces sp. NPDC047097]|uniref:hypothetical protein n=1 Tax=Streptomyces sp. NPDC047097 TaxID=3155260 RepID=UPI0033F6308C
MNERPNTPDRVNADGSRTITTKRACNGCGHLLGDVTSTEMALAVAGAPLPDVRRECPACGPTAVEPMCLPMLILAGDMHCVGLDCDHELASGEDHCEETAVEYVCATHSVAAEDGEITHAEPWPCQRGEKAAEVPR